MNDQQIARLLELMGKLVDYTGVIARHLDPTLPTEKVVSVDAWVLGETSADEPCVFLYGSHPGLQYKVATVYIEKLDTLPFDWRDGVAKLSRWIGTAPDRDTAVKKRVLNVVSPFEVVLQSTGKLTDDGNPIMRYARCRSLSNASATAPLPSTAPPSDLSPEEEFDALPGAGEQLAVQQVSAGAALKRPLSADECARTLRKIAAGKSVLPGEALRQRAMASLANLTDGDDDMQHRICEFVWGITSRTELDGGMCQAIVRWADAKRVGDEWVVNAHSRQEAKLISHAYEENPGQPELPNDAAEVIT